MPDIFPTQRPEGEQSMLQLIADTTPAMLAYFEAGTRLCRFANARYASYFGKLPHEAVGLTLREIVGKDILDQIDAYLQPLEDGVLETVRYTRQTRNTDGHQQYVETVLHPHVIDGKLAGVVALVSDVTHHHLLTQQMRASEERMRKFATITTEAIVLHRDGLIIDGNDALVRMTGYTLEELRGTAILDYVAPQFRLRALQYMRSEREDSYASGLIRKNGEFVPVETEAKSMPGVNDEYRIVLLRDMTASIQTSQRLDYLTQHDLLTRLPNRSHLNQLLEKALQQARSLQSRIAVLSLDLDQFKAVNDSLSHHAGDVLLCEMAQRLRNALRPTDVVGRIGGDDFVVLLTENPSLLETESLATRLRQVVEAPYLIEGTELVISMSIGIAMFPNDASSPEELLSNAEAAMHMAKSQGRSFVQFYTPALEGRSTRMLMQEQMLRLAVDQGEFELHYQPQVHLPSGELAGFEALVRWKHPHRGLVSPDEFIGFAENRGLIAAVDRWVLHEACRQAQIWQRNGCPAVPISVNLSAQEFRQRDVVQEVRQALERTGLDSRLLHIELTESTLMQSGGQTPDALHALKSLGVGLAIDDFGTGYSSLAYLRKHPIDRLKIDRSFISDLPHNPDAAAIVGAIVQMGRSLHLEIVAEGVENPAQRVLLEQMGCDMMQGFLVSAPLSADKAQHWMSQHCHPLQRK